MIYNSSPKKNRYYFIFSFSILLLRLSRRLNWIIKFFFEGIFFSSIKIIEILERKKKKNYSIIISVIILNYYQWKSIFSLNSTKRAFFIFSLHAIETIEINKTLIQTLNKIISLTKMKIEFILTDVNNCRYPLHMYISFSPRNSQRYK